MDLIELGAIGELVGGVAVIGSLIYVGIQVRHGTAAARSTPIRRRTRQPFCFAPPTHRCSSSCGRRTRITTNFRNETETHRTTI